MTGPSPHRVSDAPDEEDLARLQELFEAALERPLDQRQAFLVEHVPEPRLRSEVLSLLRAHASEGPLDEVAAAIGRIGAAGKGPDETHERRDPVRIGPYEIHGSIGRGGMATVYRARRIDDGAAPWVAIKVLRPEADTARVRRRFMVERQVLARLTHENIAGLLDDGLTSDGLPFLVMELVEGDHLDRYCERRRIDLPDRLALCLEVCRAVEYAHGRGVVHRDLKPDNVVVTAEGELRLLDFGIAKILDRQAFPGVGPTTSGVQLLTFTYASPEQLRGAAVTPASDIYQLGLLLLKTVTGRVPALHERWPGPLDIDITLPAELRDRRYGRRRMARLRRLVRRALSLRPEDRQASVGELARDLEELLALSRRRPWFLP